MFKTPTPKVSFSYKSYIQDFAMYLNSVKTKL